MGDYLTPLSQNGYAYTHNNPVNFIDPSGNFILTAIIVGAVAGAVIGGVVSAYKQHEETGKVDGWKVAKDALIGGVVGGVAGAVGGMTAVALTAKFGATLGLTTTLTLGQSIGIGMVSSVASGATARYTSAVLDNAFSPEKPKVNPISNAINPVNVMIDATAGGISGGLSHWATGGKINSPENKTYKQVERAKQEQHRLYCEDGADRVKVDTKTPNPLENVSKGAGNLAKRDELLNAVQNDKLKNAVNEIYRPGATIGDGGLADAVRHELSTGELVGGKSHILKATERVTNLENIINKQNLSQSDLNTAKSLLDDLRNALGGK